MMRQDLPSDPLLWLRESSQGNPPEGAEARVAARLATLAGPAGQLAPPGGSDASGAAPEPSQLKLFAERFVRWSLLPLGLGVGLGVGLHAGLSGLHAQQGGAPLHPQPALPAALPVPGVPSITPATREAEPLARMLEDRASPAVAPASAPVKSDLVGERGLLDRARRQLASGEPARALGFLELHARRFPRGQLNEEREAMWVNVLALLGRGAEAKARGQAFQERFPHSLMGSSVRSAVRSTDDAK